MITFLEQFLNGLALAGSYLLIALGITLVFGLTRIVNFAQGELVTAGAFGSYVFVRAGLPLWLSILLSSITVGLLAESLDFGILRRTLDRPLNGLIASLGLITALEAAFALEWPDSQYTLPSLWKGTFRAGDLVIGREFVVIIGVTLLATALLFLFVERSSTGRGIRALSENRIAAQVLGVRVGRLISVTFILGSAMAALAGGLLASAFPFTAFFGGQFLITGFAVAIVGGLGSISGAAAAAVLLAEAQTLGGAYISLPWSSSILLVAMMVMLILRPRGIFRSGGAGTGDVLSGEAGFDLPGEELALERANRPWRLAPKAVVVVAVLLGAFGASMLGSNSNIAIASLAYVNAIAVYGMWFAFRFAGVFSIAQAGLVGIGAYTSALVSLHLTGNFWVSIVLAMAMGAVGSGVIAVIALRTAGSNLLIVLFAINTLLVNIATNTGYLGGGQGLVVAGVPSPFGSSFDLSSTRNFYYLAFGFLVIVVAALWLLGQTPFGKRLVSIRDNEVLAASLGLNVFIHKLGTLVVTGAVAGLGGALLLISTSGTTPGQFDVNASIVLALMLVLGGVGTLLGPIVGALVVGFLPTVLGLKPYQAQLVYGLLVVAIIMIAPRGVVGQLRGWYIKLAALRSGVRMLDQLPPQSEQQLADSRAVAAAVPGGEIHAAKGDLV